MRSTTEKDETERLAFAKLAAAAFSRDKNMATFGDISPGGFLALRWGMGNDCVLVVRLDENETPVNYQQLVRTVQP